MQHNRYRCRWLAAVAVTAVVVSACSNTATETAAPSNAPEASSAPGAANNDAKHNDADVMFAQAMIPHHQQAIEMSDMVLSKQGIDREIVSLANQIKDAQGPEIEQMQGWLRDWRAASTPSPSTSMPGHDMGDMPSRGDMPGMGHMPGMGGGGHGMMSEADMADLQNAQGADAGRVFLTQMIEHHEGAITMAQNEIDNGAFPAAIDMARNIVSSQQQEIATMQEILKRS